MPPKFPSNEVIKKAGQALAQRNLELSTVDDDVQKQIPQARFGQKGSDSQQLQEMIAEQRKELKKFSSSVSQDSLILEQESTNFQDLVRSSRGQEQALTFAQISEATQEALRDKLNFDSSVSDGKREEIQQGFYEVLSNYETPAIVSDSFMAAATRGKLTEIELTDAPSKDTDDDMVDVKSHYDSYGSIAFLDEKVMAFEVNGQSQKEIMSNLAHEFTHVLQSNMEGRRETSGAFTDGKILEAFAKDLKIIDGIVQKRNVEFESKLTPDKDDQAKEIHARVVEAVFDNPEQARRTFPNTLERVEEIHSQYNQSIAKEAMASIGMGGRS